MMSTTKNGVNDVLETQMIQMLRRLPVSVRIIPTTDGNLWSSGDGCGKAVSFVDACEAALRCQFKFLVEVK